MSNLSLIEAVKSGEVKAVEEIILAGADINQGGEKGWTPLCWAAGRGDERMVKLLLEHGADVLRTGIDQRTPYMIALAASRVETAKLLREAEQATGAENLSKSERLYAKAYLLGMLRAFPGWAESRINWTPSEPADHNGETSLSDDDIIYIHQDFTVTRSMWQTEDIIFNAVTPQWKEFCANTLQFKVPDDIDLIAANGSAN